MLIFSPAQFETMLTHVLSDPTREMCGLLAGQVGRVDRVLPVPNGLRSPTAYRMDGPEFVEAMRVCEFEPLGIFHSHVAGPPTPSSTDVAEAAKSILSRVTEIEQEGREMLVAEYQKGVQARGSFVNLRVLRG